MKAGQTILAIVLIGTLATFPAAADPGTVTAEQTVTIPGGTTVTASGAVTDQPTSATAIVTTSSAATSITGQVDTSSPAVTVTTSTGVDPTTSGAVQVTTSSPTTASTSTTVSPTTTTPASTTSQVGGPGTTGGSSASATTGPVTGISTEVVLPLVPEGVDPVVDMSHRPRVSATGSAPDISGNTITAQEGVDATGTNVGASASDPSGIAIGASGAVALCLLGHAIASTDMAARPLLTATLNTLCAGTPSTITGGGNSTVPGIASGGLVANAAICLIANAAGIPEDPSTSVSSGGVSLNAIASAAIQAACGGSGGGGGAITPDTAGASGTASVPNVGSTTLDAAGAVCLLGVVSGGIPWTADVRTICGLGGTTHGPSTVDTAGTVDARDIASVPAGGNVSACVVGSGTVDLPTTATIGTACPGGTSADTPSSLAGGAGGNIAGRVPDATLSGAACVVASAIAGRNGASLNLADACAAPAGGATVPPGGGAPTETVAGVASAPAGEPAGAEAAAPAPPGAPAGAAVGVTVPAVGTVTVPAPGQSAGIPAGLSQLPSTSTSAGLGALALLALGALAAFRRRRHT